MKRIGMLMLAALMGSAVTIGCFQLIDEDKPVKIEYVSATPVQRTAFSSDGEAPLDFTAIAEKVMPAVVHIKSTQSVNPQNEMYDRKENLPDPFREFFRDDFFRDFFGPDFRYHYRDDAGPMLRVGTGSGVIINGDGYIVTNNHVIDQAESIEVTLHNNEVHNATVVGADPSTDLALLKIEAKNLPSMPLVDSDQSKVGEWVLAVGNPFNLNSTVTAGIISAKGRNINILRDEYAIESFIQTDAAINQGNSGGALVNLQGGLIGINTAIASPTGVYSGYGFAVPSNIVKKVIEDILEYGTVQRGTLGIMIADVDARLKREKDLEVSSGVYVDSLLENSAAAKAGMKAGDVIVELDGKKISSASALRELIARHRPGEKVNLTVDRSGKEHEFTVTLQLPKGMSTLAKNNKHDILNALGATFETVDEKTARRLDIDGGVRVTDLQSGKLRKTGMREGFIITEVDGAAVKDVDQLAKKLSDRKGGVMLEGVYEDISGVYYYAFGL